MPRAMNSSMDDGICWNTVDTILQISGDSSSMMPHLILLFEESTTRDLAKLIDSIENQNSTDVRSSAHAIKSVCGSIGASRARQLAADIESTYQNNSNENLLELAKNLESEIGRSIVVLNEYLSTL